MKRYLSFGILLALLWYPSFSRAQIVEHRYDIPSTCSAVTMTMRADEGGLPFLYVAAKEGGLRIYEISGSPRLVKTIESKELRSLDVMNMAQSGRYLFLALGNHFNSRQGAGLGVIDVTRPSEASVVDVWTDGKLKGGAGAVATEGTYVYLGAMKNGLLIFEVSQRGQVNYLSRFQPDLKYPDPKPDEKKYNARGVTVRNDLVYLSFDAGGLRVIDVRNKTRPVEIGRFANPALNKKPRAYNNIALDGDLAYVAVDYCGLEVLNIRNPSAIRLVGWWNPEKCEESAWRWFKSSVHANEIAFDKGCKTVFLSSGRSDLQIVSVANPERPTFVGEYGGVDNDIGTWGVSKRGRDVYLSYICTLGIPFSSRWSGVKVLRYNDRCSADN